MLNEFRHWMIMAGAGCEIGETTFIKTAGLRNKFPYLITGLIVCLITLKEDPNPSFGRS